MMEAQPNRRVLIVDDQREIHEDFSEMLRSPTRSSDDLASAFLERLPERPRLPSFELLHAYGGEEALQVVTEASGSDRPIAVAFVDIRMPPGMDGLETVRRIREMDRELEVVIMTAYTEQPLSEILREMDLPHKLLYIRKPFSREEVQQITLSLSTKWNLERQVRAGERRLAEAHRRLDEVEGLKSEVERLRSALQERAPTNAADPG